MRLHWREFSLSRLAQLAGMPAIVEQEPSYRYRAYGMAIRSDLALPELADGATSPVDLTIRVGATGRPLPQISSGAVSELGPDSHYLAWPGVGAFLVQGTDTIVVEPAPGVSMPLLNLPLLGPVMARLLHVRGLLVLHASAVDLGGKAAVFLGPKGAGKSTTAAAFVGAGHRLLADDVLAIGFSNPAAPHIVPGFPQLKLGEDAANQLLSDASFAMPPPIPEFPKQQRRLKGGFSHATVPPSCIYVMARGTSAGIVSLATDEALGAILAFSFASLFRQRNGPLGGADAARHLAQCSALVDSVRIARLELPRGLDRLSEIVRLVADDIA